MEIQWSFVEGVDSLSSRSTCRVEGVECRSSEREDNASIPEVGLLEAMRSNISTRLGRVECFLEKTRRKCLGVTSVRGACPCNESIIDGRHSELRLTSHVLPVFKRKGRAVSSWCLGSLLCSGGLVRVLPTSSCGALPSSSLHDHHLVDRLVSFVHLILLFGRSPSLTRVDTAVLALK
mmetsp:Transcript_35199/g.52346  ORF Transcript_35199/g.52346 Transcript_35199/m.52346 type:complete len:178 (+) Transcript_35199:1209-1742(+)